MEALGQKYNTLEEARNAVQQNKFMTQAIVKENDGTYAIQEFDSDVEEKVSKTLRKDNTDKYTLKNDLKSAGVASTVVELFSSDYDNNFNIGLSFESNENTSLDSHDLMMKGAKSQKEVSNTFINPNKNATDLKSEMQSLTSQMSELSSLNTTLNKISSGDGQIKVSDLKTLTSVYKSIMKKIDSGELKVPDEMKSKLNSFSEIVNKVENDYKEYSANIEEMNERRRNVSQLASTSLPRLEALAKKTGNNEVANQLVNLQREFSNVLAEGDKEKIALYSAYMESIEKILSNPYKGMSESGKYNHILRELSNAEKSFNQASVILNDAKTNSVHDKENGKKRLMSALSNLSVSPEIEKIFNNYFNNLGSNSVITPNMSAFSANNAIEQGLKEDGVVSQNINTQAYKPIEIQNSFQNMNVQDVSEFIKSDESDEMLSVIAQINKETQSLVRSIEKTSESEARLNNSMSDLNDFIVENPDVTNLFQEEIQNEINEIMLEVNKPEKEDYIDEVINDMISQSELLEQNINTEFNSDDSSIVPLLKKFRDIIEELDLKTRSSISKKLAAKMIDDSFSKYIYENSKRLQNIENSKDEIMGIIKSSSEVRDSKMPYKLKQMKLEDCAQKIALVALSYSNV